MKILFFIVFLTLSLDAQKIVLGRFETITLNQFELKDLKAKIDTGAKTSSIHCSFIKKLPNKKVTFTILDDDYKKFKPISFTSDISRVAKVKSSNGSVEKRYFIKTKITLLNKEYFTEFSLTNRSDMKFPILIGRSLLSKGFCVDVTKEYTRKKNDKL
jgi:hypothetical protein